jgi:hypothetical protein
MPVKLYSRRMNGSFYSFQAGASKKDKRKQLAALEARALGWHGFDDRAPAEKTTAVLCGMFSPDDFLENMLLAGEADVVCCKRGSARLPRSSAESSRASRVRPSAAVSSCWMRGPCISALCRPVLGASVGRCRGAGCRGHSSTLLPLTAAHIPSR